MEQNLQKEENRLLHFNYLDTSGLFVNFYMNLARVVYKVPLGCPLCGGGGCDDVIDDIARDATCHDVIVTMTSSTTTAAQWVP